MYSDASTGRLWLPHLPALLWRRSQTLQSLGIGDIATNAAQLEARIFQLYGSNQVHPHKFSDDYGHRWRNSALNEVMATGHTAASGAAYWFLPSVLF